MSAGRTPVSAAVRAAAERLAAADVPSARHDAEALAAHVLGVRRGVLGLGGELNRAAADRLSDLVGQRAARRPLQHLLGSAGFRYLEIAVGPGVFVPRPETEVVVEYVVHVLREQPEPVVVDLCAGSGAIALSIAHEVPAALVHAVECDPGAYGWLERNAATRTAAGDRPVALHLGDAADALTDLDGRLDMVVSNPPYVGADERAAVDPEVREHDPEVALFAGADGLDVLRVVQRAARRLLRPGGQVVVEHSDRQGLSVPALFVAAGGWRDVTDHRDLLGRDRFTTARRSG